MLTIYKLLYKTSYSSGCFYILIYSKYGIKERNVLWLRKYSW